MRLISDFVHWKLNNLYARLNDTLSVFMNPDSGLLSENSRLGKFISYRLTPQIRAKFFLIPAVIVSGMLGACFTTLNGEELKAVVEKAMKALPEDLRAAVTLREFDGLSYEDIADVMECPVGTVRSRIFRAREAIDKQVQIQVFGNDDSESGDHLSLVKS